MAHYCASERGKFNAMRHAACALLLLLLVGCSAYVPAPGAHPTTDVRTVARGCMLGTADDVGAGLIGALITAPRDFSAMDTCMAQQGWVRR